MLRLHRTEARRGQAMTEFVIWVFVLLGMIEGIFMFGRATNLKLHCYAAARYTAWAHAVSYETDLDDSAILARAKAYYPIEDEYGAQWQQLDPASGYDAGEANPGGPSGSGLDLFGAMNGLFGMVSNTKGWHVSASYNPGGILDSTLPDGLTVRSEYFVSGGPWDKKQTRGDLTIMTVKGMLMAWSFAVLN